MVLVTVCLRYFFSAGFIGAEDLGIWLHVGLIALGAPLSLNSALAMRLDVFVKMLPESLQKVTPIGADVFTVLSALILSFGGSEIMTMLGGVSPTLAVPEWIRFGFLGASGALILVVLLLQRIAEGRILPVLLSLAVGVALYAGIPHVSLDLDWPPSIFLGLIAAVGLVLAAPLPHAFLAAAYVVIAFGSSLPEPAIVSATVTGISKFLLLAIPFFLLAGGLFDGLRRRQPACALRRRHGRPSQGRTGADDTAHQRSLFPAPPALRSQMPLSAHRPSSPSWSNTAIGRRRRRRSSPRHRFSTMSSRRRSPS